MVLSHPPAAPRIVLAFRGTYSVANTVIDLSTVPQEYIPYPGDEDDEDDDEGEERPGLRKRNIDPLKAECTNCTVHAGFMKAWRETRPYVLPQLKELVLKYPGYQLTLVGHSLGGAIAGAGSAGFPVARVESAGHDVRRAEDRESGFDAVYRCCVLRWWRAGCGRDV